MSFDIGYALNGYCLCKAVKHIPGPNFYVGTLFTNADGDLPFKANHADTSWVGCIVKIEGTVGVYNDKPQFSGNIEVVENPTEEMLKACVPYTDMDISKMWADLVYTANGFKQESLRYITSTLLDKRAITFQNSPAGRSHHHAYIGGLITHTYRMYKAALAVCEVYPELNKELLLAGVLLHDIGKVDEFVYSKTGMVSDYTDVGNMLGHLNIGVAKVYALAEELGVTSDPYVKALMNMIAAHHGRPEWGSVAAEYTNEALVLSCLDLMDARIDMMRVPYAATEEGTLTDVVPGVGHRMFKV